jgi:hypothetical protein
LVSTFSRYLVGEMVILPSLSREIPMICGSLLSFSMTEWLCKKERELVVMSFNWVFLFVSTFFFRLWVVCVELSCQLSAENSCGIFSWKAALVLTEKI